MYQLFMYFIMGVCCCILFSACTGSGHIAPIMDLSGPEPLPDHGIHRVLKGETLYEIAWRYGLDYRELAGINHIRPPYTIHPGEPLQIRRREPAYGRKAGRRIPCRLASARPRKMNSTFSGLVWPAKGRIIRGYSAMNKGIDIAGRLGSPVYAIQDGKVVYSGNGLRGYGNLIIIKHNNVYLSAYAHNSVLLVKEGDRVKKKQIIARMGNTQTDKIMLHFEVRRAGKPIDPLSFLPGR